jgi:hypothetical protein
MKLDVERLLNWLMVVLLTLRADCSLVTLKPAHLSPYLPGAKRDDSTVWRHAICASEMNRGNVPLEVLLCHFAEAVAIACIP